MVGALLLDAGGTLWAATEGGLSRIADGRVHTLTAKDGLPCDAVHWMIEDNDRSFWLYTACGLARIPRSQVDAWAAALEKLGQAPPRVHATVFDQSDGVRIQAAAGSYSPQVGKSPDGRISFLTWDGVSVIDPHRLPMNALPPPVHIEQITADGHIYTASSGLRLSPLVRDVSIHYTALSLVAPEKIRFRYKLEGQDLDWKAVVNDRRVQYSNLPPGEYRFLVTASNNSGVWNEAGAALQFAIAPAYYQTAWFRAVFAAVFVGLLWTAHRMHVMRLLRQFNLTMEARVAERTRIARDLHDTLLQSSQGLLLKFESALKLLPDRPAEARQRLEHALDQATEATIEARDAVQGLRSSSVETVDPVRLLSDAIEELTGDDASALPAIHAAVHGIPRPLKPIVGNEAYRITREALRNAVQHADAHHITAEIRYEERQFRVRVRDDGRGFDEQGPRGKPPTGHFGLQGMRERAENVGGSFVVWTKPGFGTQIELRIPGAFAYVLPPRRRFPFFNR
jgi:signal transduction histidine kinase